jgi:hypothetical protein
MAGYEGLKGDQKNAGMSLDPARLRAREFLAINGEKVVGPQGAAISDGLTDTQKIAAILDRLREHGLVRTA